MLMPSIFGEDLFDEMMDFPWDREFYSKRNPVFGKHEKNLMKTDVRETENGYEVDVDLPGFKKDEMMVKLDNGYLMISASKTNDHEQKQEDGKYIRRERYVGSCSRSFYVGDAVTQDEIHARYEDGILKLTLPKKEQQQIRQNDYIAIEG